MIKINYHSLFGSKRWKIRQARFINSWLSWFPIIITFHGTVMNETFWNNYYLQIPYSAPSEEQNKARYNRKPISPRFDVMDRVVTDEAIVNTLTAKRRAAEVMDRVYAGVDFGNRSDNTAVTIVGRRVEIQSYELPQPIVKDVRPFYRNRLEEVE